MEPDESVAVRRDILSQIFLHSKTADLVESAVMFTLYCKREAGFKMYYDLTRAGQTFHSQLVIGDRHTCPIYEAEMPDACNGVKVVDFHTHPSSFRHIFIQEYRKYGLDISSQDMICLIGSQYRFLASYVSLMDSLYFSPDGDMLDMMIPPISIRAGELEDGMISIHMSQFNSFPPKELLEREYVLRYQEELYVMENSGLLNCASLFWNLATRKFEGLEKAIDLFAATEVRLVGHEEEILDIPEIAAADVDLQGLLESKW